LSILLLLTSMHIRGSPLSNHTNWLAHRLNDLLHVHSAKQHICEGPVELCKVLFLHEDLIY